MIEIITGYVVKTIAIVLVFGLAVFVHEFGHMFFALIRGVGVESFAIGMGPRIVSWKWRGIDFSLRWFPVGGFVKLAGLMPGEAAEEEAAEGPENRAYTPAEQTNSIEMRLEREETIDRLEPIEGKKLAESSYDDLMALSNKGLLTKLLVFGGGVFMNYITAIVAMVWFLTMPQKELLIPAKIWKVEESVPAYAAGLRSGDHVVAVNGQPVQYPYQIIDAVEDIVTAQGLSKNDKDAISSQTLLLSVLRGEQGTSPTQHELTLPFGHFFHEKVQFATPPLVGNVALGQPAQKAGLQKGDRIVSIDGVKIADFNDIRALVSDKQGVELAVEFERDGTRQVVQIKPGTNPEEPEKGMLGLESGAGETIEVPGLPFGEALVNAPGATWYRLKELVRIHIQFFSRATWRQIGEGLGGPVLIARITAEATERGLPYLVSFFITLNLLLMVFNLLPLPVLDGGFILISIIESIIRRPVPPRVLAPIYTFFMFFFIGLMLLITFLDVHKWVS